MSGFPLQGERILVELPLIFLYFNVKVESSRKQTLLENAMIDDKQDKEEWLNLCEQASVEQDPERLMLLTREICRLLDEREKGLKNGRLP